MALQRQQYFRSPPQRRRWTGDFSCRTGRRRKENRIKRQYEEEWGYWMRTEGRKQGLTDPIIFNGPPLGHMVTEEWDEATDVKNLKKLFPGTEAEIKEEIRKSAPKGKARLPYDIEPG